MPSAKKRTKPINLPNTWKSSWLLHMAIRNSRISTNDYIFLMYFASPVSINDEIFVIAKYLIIVEIWM